MKWVRLLAALLSLAAGNAQAHLMPAGHGGLRVDEAEVMSVVSIPVAVLSGWDDDGNGLLSLAELNTHRSALDRQLAQRFRLFDGDAPERIIFQDLLFSDVRNEALTGTDHLILMRRSQWNEKIHQLRVQADLFAKAGPERELMLSAARAGTTEMTILRADRPGHRFFRDAMAVFGDAVRNGAEHILLGYDHLLFLLTLLVAGTGWRYWLATITAFTVAHSVTLALAATGMLTLPGVVVEPLIALSIVVVAIGNLFRVGVERRQRTWLIFACGLLHGLGIASALDLVGLEGTGKSLTLAGFNVGVEIGQLGVAACALTLLAVVRRHGSASMQEMAARACSVFAALAGMGWFIARVAHAG
ncbi:HupE/UreJ family protein [Noviherbaspirillum galbum]|uniref:HupE/UreJ family protein n=1 Tax=Noviherbaspirillum galbum TaxID=2709383 RepID=A0A6B3SJI3_9BURK|nr:HupE/UreJ family protein [Noviherbaspirillum galbum]NEX60880.1 HupE/UreJ family protein [Noviherbaspirillum galbum]